MEYLQEDCTLSTAVIATPKETNPFGYNIKCLPRQPALGVSCEMIRQQRLHACLDVKTDVPDRYSISRVCTGSVQ